VRPAPAETTHTGYLLAKQNTEEKSPRRLPLAPQSRQLHPPIPSCPLHRRIRRRAEIGTGVRPVPPQRIRIDDRPPLGFLLCPVSHKRLWDIFAPVFLYPPPYSVVVPSRRPVLHTSSLGNLSVSPCPATPDYCVASSNRSNLPRLAPVARVWPLRHPGRYLNGPQTAQRPASPLRQAQD